MIGVGNKCGIAEASPIEPIAMAGSEQACCDDRLSTSRKAVLHKSIIYLD